MKKALAILAAITAIGITIPATAEANWGHNQRIVSYTSCGRPVYAVYQIVGYDRCGNPIGQWVTQRANCGCNRCAPRPVHGHGGFGGHNQGFCPPPQHGHRSSGGSFFFRFGR